MEKETKPQFDSATGKHRVLRENEARLCGQAAHLGYNLPSFGSAFCADAFSRRQGRCSTR